MADKKKPNVSVADEPKIEILPDAEAVLADVASREQAVRDKAFAIAQRRAAPVDPMLDWLEAERASYRRPAARVSCASDSYRIEIELPGVAKKDIEIRAASGRIVVRAVRRADSDPGTAIPAIIDEFGVPELWRDVQLPPDCIATSIGATLDHGVLVLVLARSQPMESTDERVESCVVPPVGESTPSVKKPAAKRGKKRAP